MSFNTKIPSISFPLIHALSSGFSARNNQDNSESELAIPTVQVTFRVLGAPEVPHPKLCHSEISASGGKGSWYSWKWELTGIVAL